MPSPEKENLSPEEQEKSAEWAWLQQNLTIFWPAAHFGYEQQGRGAVVINIDPEDQDKSPFHYANQDRIEEGEDEATERLLQFVAEYNPENEFVVALIKPDLEISFHQIVVSKDLVEAVNTYLDDTYQPKATSVEAKLETELEVPDLETLMAWEEEGGCEAACPHSCWVEPDGVCPHGKPSWLIELGLI